jgi:hypothetical protein
MVRERERDGRWQRAMVEGKNDGKREKTMAKGTTQRNGRGEIAMAKGNH